MRRTLIATVLALFTAPVFATPLQYSLGLGMESRLVKEVNPDYSNPQFAGQLYGKIRHWPWDLSVELTPQEKRNTASGNLSITSATTTLGFWGRYEFRAPDRRWATFGSLGMGMYFDRVTTEFNGASDARSSRRGFAGLGLGFGTTVWNRLQLEAEARGASVEEREEMLFSVLLRAGIQI